MCIARFTITRVFQILAGCKYCCARVVSTRSSICQTWLTPKFCGVRAGNYPPPYTYQLEYIVSYFYVYFVPSLLSLSLMRAYSGSNRKLGIDLWKQPRGQSKPSFRILTLHASYTDIQTTFMLMWDFSSNGFSREAHPAYRGGLGFGTMEVDRDIFFAISITIFCRTFLSLAKMHYSKKFKCRSSEREIPQGTEKIRYRYLRNPRPEAAKSQEIRVSKR